MLITLGADETIILVLADLGISRNISGPAPRFSVWNRQGLADFRVLLASTGSGRLEKHLAGALKLTQNGSDYWSRQTLNLLSLHRTGAQKLGFDLNIHDFFRNSLLVSWVREISWFLRKLAAPIWLSYRVLLLVFHIRPSGRFPHRN